MCFLGEFEWFWLISGGGDCEIWESWGFKWYVNDFSRIQMIANDCQWMNFEIVVNIFFVILRNRGSAIFSGWKKVNPVGKSTSRCFAGCHYYNIYILPCASESQDPWMIVHVVVGFWSSGHKSGSPDWIVVKLSEFAQRCFCIGTMGVGIGLLLLVWFNDLRIVGFGNDSKRPRMLWSLGAE